MNFFEQQDIARRNTKRLVFLLLLAVLSLITITVLFVAVMLTYFQGTSGYANESLGFGQNLLNSISWELLAWISLIVGTVVSFGSLYKVMQLRGGGSTVAEAMNGHLINLHTDDADEKKILNVVEEIAIASGTPVPPVYVLEDDAINAFAAGHTPQNAVIGITRGCIRLLSRDELQGVIAHEFSHIFHGDMRINIRLVALLHGILLLGLIGSFIVRTTHHRSMVRSSRDKSPAALLAIGVGLIVIGYAGTFFGNIIKAAVSRQREFLADASAVQFTRNPDGIAGALKKIGGHTSGSRLEAEHVAEYSHMLFGQGIGTAFNALMATHPPLEARIKRIEPRWDGKFLHPSAAATAAPEQTVSSATAANATNSSAIASSAMLASALTASIDIVGQPSANHLADAQQKLSAIGPELYAAAHDPFSARAIIFGLLLDSQTTQRALQWQQIKGLFSDKELIDLTPLAEQAACIEASLRLPLIELTLPALKELTVDQYKLFKQAMEVLIQADSKTTVMEWALQRIVHHHLDPHEKIAGRTQELRKYRDECQLLLSVLAYAGAKNETQAAAAFAAAATELRFSALTILSRRDCKMSLLDQALTKLNSVKPLQKPLLLKAMATCVTQDGKVTVAEAELFRAIADGLDCPVPPLVTSAS